VTRPGTYTVDESTGRVIHHVQAASNPAWIGDDFVRWCRFEGQNLLIGLYPKFENPLSWERLPMTIRRRERAQRGTNMRHSFVRLGSILAALVIAAPALAHHSFAAEFDAERPIQLRGTVTQVEFMNPHSWIHIDVKKPDGTVEQWAIEGGTPNTLFRMGINRNSLAKGTEILVDGYQARDGSKRASGRDITLADGSKLFLGGSAAQK
jgi:hypothetical protein